MQSVLTDLERRVVGNLSIPRNVTDIAHELRTDPHAPTLPERDVPALLADLAAAGLVVNLGATDDVAKLAASLEAHPAARPMPDEKADIWSKRLKIPGRDWRAAGDLWIFTDAGFDKLHEPVFNPAPLSVPEVEALLSAHASRVVQAPFEGSIHDADGGRLLQDTPLAAGERDESVRGERVATLLPEEYAQWAKRVSDECEQRTGRRPQQPLAGGAGYADATETLIIDAENGKTAGYAVTTPWFMALTTVAVTDADTGSTITEATGATGYARKSVAAADMNSAASPGGSASNANAIVFAAITAGSATVIGFAKCIASTVGVLQKYGTCSSTVISSTQTPPQFSVGAFTTSVD